MRQKWRCSTAKIKTTGVSTKCVFAFDSPQLYLCLFLLLFPSKILFIRAATVDDTAIGSNLNDAVCNCVDQFVVVRGEDQISFERGETVIYRADRFQIQMVGGLVQQQEIRSEQHHPSEHTTHLFATRQNVDGFENAFVGKEHSAQKSAQICLGRLLGILR